MKAITILQPWASLIACGAKKIETRGWATKYRGPIAIHAGKKLFSNLNSNLDAKIMDVLIPEGYFSLNDLPLGKVIAIADLVDCQRIVLRVKMKNNGLFVVNYAELENGNKVGGNELDFGDYEYNRYAWILANVRPIEPVPAKGQQRLWEWDGDINESIKP